MPSNPPKSVNLKTKMSQIYPYVFLGIAVFFICWVAFLLPCSPKYKLILLAAFAMLAMITFIYFKLEIAGAIKTKTSNMDSIMEEVKDCHKMLVNEEKIATISKFASIVAHELKNPLSSLKNISYYLIKTVKSEDTKGKRMMEMLSSEVDRVDRIIGDFAAISYAKKINKIFVSVSELVENVLAEYKIEPGIELKKEIEPGIEANIDPERMAVVIKSLIKNAKQAIGEKGVISISLKKVGTFFELVVTDSGPGIDNETVEHIFEPMFTTKTKSLGLGLTVLKETVDAHEGKVDVDTGKDKGSTFRIFIPLEPKPSA